MELTLKEQINEAEAKRSWRRVFFALFAPVYVRYILWAMMFCGIGLLNYYLRHLMLALTAGYFIAILSWYPRIWKVYRETFRKSGAFNHPTTVRLTDTFIEIACGENTAKNEYGVFSGFVELNDVIALINQKSIAATFKKKDFADGGEEFMQCLRNSGVKKIELWGFKRWGLAFLPVALMALLVVVHIANVQNRLWMYEKACKTQCCSNLKQMMCGLFIYSDDLKKAGNASFQQSFTLDEVVAAGLADESHCGCPKSCAGYAYVPYGRLLDKNASSAANTPVLFDYVFGCHRKRKHLLWGKDTLQTLVAFEDGHVSIEENLASFMDLYERYAPLMSRKNANELRRFCEDHDGLIQ
ncbi:MAG: hypothetical protein IKP00_03475 [Victivallales bacterium]|nr:hypothetical protein [Victivallales bacterium]